MKKVTYNGLIYTVEDKRYRNDKLELKLSGIYWVQASDCTHWLAGWFNKFFSYFD